MNSKAEETQKTLIETKPLKIIYPELEQRKRYC